MSSNQEITHTFAIRPARPGDVGEIKEILQLLRLDTADFVWDLEDFILRHIQRGEYFVVEGNGKLAGIMSLRVRKNVGNIFPVKWRRHPFLAKIDDLITNVRLRFLPEHLRKGKMTIETLGIRKEFQSNGMGGQLVAFAKNAAREKGFSILHAYSFFEYNTTKFYARQGFRELYTTKSYSGHPYYCFETKL